MKGLLRKDIYALQGTFGILAVVMALYVAISYFGHNSSMLTVMAVIMVILLPVNSITYDEAYHWDRYVLTAPVSRQLVVGSKYLLCALLAGFLLLIGMTSGLLLGEPLVETFFNTLCVAALSLVISVLALPAMFKWGAQRGRLVLCGVAGAAGALLGSMLLDGWFSQVALASLAGGSLRGGGLLVAAVLLATALVTALSYLLSCHIYRQKEF